MGEYRTRVTVRWSDMDAFGVVNNVQYLRYLEQARVDLLFGTARQAGLTELTEGVVVARVEVDYRAPMRWSPEGVEVVLWVEKRGGASFTLAYEVRDDSTVYAQARTVMVAYDFSAGRPRKLLDKEREFLAGYRRQLPSVTTGGV